MKERTQEERERAAQQIASRPNMPWTQETILDVDWGSDHPMWTPLTRIAIDLQCELNEASETLEWYRREVRSILGQKSVHDIPELECQADSWLKRNGDPQ